VNSDPKVWVNFLWRRLFFRSVKIKELVLQEWYYLAKYSVNIIISCNVFSLFKLSDKIPCSNLSPKPAFPAHLAQNLPEHACMHAVYHLLIGQNVLKYKGQKYYTKLY
jgi:hypothetical protein